LSKNNHFNGHNWGPLCRKCGKSHGIRIITKEWREKISKANMGRILSEETRKKMSESKSGEKNHMYGKHVSKKTREKISKKRKGKNIGKNNPFYGKHHTKESKEKISKTHMGKKRSEETRRKMREAAKHKLPMSEETKRKISIGNMGRKKGLVSEEHKRKLSVAREKFLNSCDASISGISESKKHYKMKIECKQILEKNGYTVRLERYVGIGNNIYYIVDVYGKKGNKSILIECGNCPREKLKNLRSKFSNVVHISYNENKNKLNWIL